MSTWTASGRPSAGDAPPGERPATFGAWSPLAVSGMGPPGSRRQQLDLLGHQQRAKFHGKAFDEILVGEHRRPVGPTVGVVVELPEMDELVDRTRVGLEVADQLLVVAALLERGIAELGVELDGLGHLPDVKRIGPHLVHGHGVLLNPRVRGPASPSGRNTWARA